MRQYLLLTLLFAPGIVFAQAPDLEKTCVNVAKSFLLTDQITVGIVQSFPELKPPGVRMSYSTKPGAPKAEMSDIFECEFENPNPPHRLSRFCVSSTCYSPTEEDGERKRRFAEMRVVLDRAEARP
ncbi:hypothetical protein LPB79_38050 (plasmid) [Rhizobium sp. T136]|nr:MULTISPECIES: hypothetical protein [Rhizobium]MCA0807156.1 hypothetical protein [Rhizobium sp. T1473]MCS0460265.1 hypothetical protein [Rhizobium favelukesii]UFS85739.1 hypothetical protein LPB79_38050 [Rhizobium sp. T136]